MKKAWLTLALLTGMAVSSVGTATAAPPDWAKDATGQSNMGLCSSYLGQLGVSSETNARVEVNHLIQDMGIFFGIDSPGDLYRVRAKQQVNGAAQEECVQRPHPQ